MEEKTLSLFERTRQTKDTIHEPDPTTLSRTYGRSDFTLQDQKKKTTWSRSRPLSFIGPFQTFRYEWRPSLESYQSHHLVNLIQWLEFYSHIYLTVLILPFEIDLDVFVNREQTLQILLDLRLRTRDRWEVNFPRLKLWNLTNVIRFLSRW